jgi:hypothetical protein
MSHVFTICSLGYLCLASIRELSLASNVGTLEDPVLDTCAALVQELPIKVSIEIPWFIRC